MEIHTNLTQCVNGHYYNAANHSTCPICGAAADGTGSFGPTVDPNAASASVGSVGSFGPTVDPNAATPSGGYSYTEPVVPADSGSASPVQGFSPTVAINHDDANHVEPVVGWLVCIEGPMRGNDYRIHEGYNYIGREIGDIHIRGDQTISRQRHAKIDYDSNGHQYFFSPDEGRNLLRVNDQTIRTPVELHDYDVITVGQTKLLFIGLCGEQFSWKQD